MIDNKDRHPPHTLHLLLLRLSLFHARITCLYTSSPEPFCSHTNPNLYRISRLERKPTTTLHLTTYDLRSDLIPHSFHLSSSTLSSPHSIRTTNKADSLLAHKGQHTTPFPLFHSTLGPEHALFSPLFSIVLNHTSSLYIPYSPGYIQVNLKRLTSHLISLYTFFSHTTIRYRSVI